MTADFLKKLPLCENLTKLEIGTAWNLGISGFNSISKLRNLESLEICFAASIDYSRSNNKLLHKGKGIDTGLRPSHMLAWFENKNMEKLEKLSLAGCESLMDNDQVIRAIALNCPRLKYIDLYKGNSQGSKIMFRVRNFNPQAGLPTRDFCKESHRL